MLQTGTQFEPPNPSSPHPPPPGSRPPGPGQQDAVARSIVFDARYLADEAVVASMVTELNALSMDRTQVYPPPPAFQADWTAWGVGPGLESEHSVSHTYIHTHWGPCTSPGRTPLWRIVKGL